jgi:hypothetical protein
VIDQRLRKEGDELLPLKKVFVQHVTKTAGTSLFYFLEPNFSYHATVTSQRFWNQWSADHPMLARMPPSLANTAQYAHGHFKEFFRQVMFGDWFAIGTSRSVDERLISSLHHQVRENAMDKRLVAFLRGHKLSSEWVLKGLINNSHMGFYATTSTRSVLWEADTNFHIDLPTLANQALANIDRYDYIIDSSDFSDHCQHLAEGLRHANNVGQVNTRHSFGQASAFDQRDIDSLRSKFPAFFELEDAIYARLEAKSQASLNQPLAQLLNRARRRQDKTVALLPDRADVAGMSPAIPAGLHGWENEFYRELLPGASVNNIAVKTGNYVAHVWLWSADTERFKRVKLRVMPSKDQTQRVDLIENPSKHLWLLSVAFTATSDGSVSLVFDEPDDPARTLWLGAKIYYQEPVDHATG